jgi:hypothetical protein
MGLSEGNLKISVEESCYSDVTFRHEDIAVQGSLSCWSIFRSLAHTFLLPSGYLVRHILQTGQCLQNPGFTRWLGHFDDIRSVAAEKGRAGHVIGGWGVEVYYPSLP